MNGNIPQFQDERVFRGVLREANISDEKAKQIISSLFIKLTIF